MRGSDQNTTRAWTPLLLASLIALVSFAGAVDLARAVAEMGPRVGDLVRFEGDLSRAADRDTRLDVPRVAAGSCTLEVSMLRRFGGSLVIEERQPATPRTYRVHWAGRRTSQGAGDCGAAADLLLQTSDLEILAMAAGGYGLPTATAVGAGGRWGRSTPKP